VALRADALHPDVPIAENGDVAAWDPSLCSKRSANNVVFCPVATCGEAAKLASSTALGHHAAHGNLEMAALIPGNRADVGALNEHADRGAGAAYGPGDIIAAILGHQIERLGNRARWNRIASPVLSDGRG